MENLQSIKRIVCSINSPFELEQSSLNLICLFKRIDFTQIPSKDLEAELSQICFQIVAHLFGSKLSPKSLELLKTISEKESVPDLVQKTISKMVNPKESQPNENPDTKHIAVIEKPISSSPFHRFELNVNSQFGVSFIELNGDFLWMDDMSKKYFKGNQKHFERFNIFEMMIPFSKAYLKGKFGDAELFKNKADLYDPIHFSYVIYSHASFDKFLKVLQAEQVTDLDKYANELNEKAKEMSIYFQYLQALSSRASLVSLAFTKRFIKDSLKSKKEEIYMTDSLKSILGDSVSKSPHNSSESELGQQSDEDDTEIKKVVVLLETRPAKSIMKFPYIKMESDPKILQFNADMRKKLQK